MTTTKDKAIEAHGLTWDFLRDLSLKTECSLACKLARALIDVGAICEQAVEREAFWRLQCEHLEVLRLTRFRSGGRTHKGR